MRQRPLWFFGILIVTQFAFADVEPPAIKEMALAEELHSRVQSEQALRQRVVEFTAAHNLTDGTVDLEKLGPKVTTEFKDLTDRLKDEDRQNLIWLKAVVSKHGWPGKSLVGGQAAKDAWLLVQHADQDREFQQQCLNRMQALPKGEVDPRDIAYLTDRVLVGTGKKQTYGTQLIFQNGRLVPQPIENADEVDQRRKAAGLEPLNEYLKAAEKAYLPAKSTPATNGNSK